MQVGAVILAAKVVGGGEGTDGMMLQKFRFESRQQGGLLRVGLVPLRGDVRLALEEMKQGRPNSRARRYSASVMPEP